MVRKIKPTQETREEAFNDRELEHLSEMVFNTLWVDLANIVCGVMEPPDMEKVATEMMYSPAKKSGTWTEYLGRVRKALINGREEVIVEG